MPIRRALTDKEIRDFTRLAATTDWNMPKADNEQRLLDSGWIATDGPVGPRLYGPSNMFGSVNGLSDTASISLVHTSWAPNPPKTVVEADGRMAEVAAVVADLLTMPPTPRFEIIRERSGLAWTLPSGARIWVYDDKITGVSPELAETQDGAAARGRAYTSDDDDE